MEFNLNEDDFVLFTAGQLSKRKNHEVVIKALAAIENKNVKLLICGLGELESYLRELIAELGLENRVTLAGYRNDVIEQLHAADLFCVSFFTRRSSCGSNGINGYRITYCMFKHSWKYRLN